MVFHKLNKSDKGWVITHKKTFPANAPAFKKETIRRVFEFAYAMTFGKQGEHRNHRTGGSLQRKNGEIFADTFQGKLAECAACNLFYKIDDSVMPDFSVSKLGIWDNVDVVVNKKKIAVKSTKSFGNLLLLEQHDWDTDGRYLPNEENGTDTYDYFLLIRIKPFCEDIMKNHRWLYVESIDKQTLWNEIEKVVWLYDYAGYISINHLKELIKQQFVIYKGDTLNGATRIDADNYYIQAGDMFDVKELVAELQTSQSSATFQKKKRGWFWKRK